MQRGNDLEIYLALPQEKLISGPYLYGRVGEGCSMLLRGGYAGNTRSFYKKPVILADFGVFLKPYKFNHSTGEYTFPPLCQNAHLGGKTVLKNVLKM